MSISIVTNKLKLIIMQTKVQQLLHSFFDKSKLQKFAKGEIIIKPDQNQQIFFLTEGVVRMFNPSINSMPTLNIYRSHALLPMSLILNSQKNRYTYDALTEVKGYFAPKIKFKQFLRKNPQVLFDLLIRIYRGLDGFFMRLEALLSGNAYSRILTQLIIYTRRFGQDYQNKIIFDWHLTHHQLASQTGLARESVTKEIKKLQNKGLIGYTGKKLFVNSLLELEKEYFSYSL